MSIKLFFSGDIFINNDLITSVSSSDIAISLFVITES